MRSPFRLLLMVCLSCAAAFGTARYTGDKGSRGHRLRLAAGASHACALLDDGTVMCWGSNQYGQLGDGTLTQRSSPVPVSNLSGVVSIAAGQYHTCAIVSTGGVRCWGNNFDGQLGNGGTVSSAIPVAVAGLTGAVSIAPGAAHTCAVRSSGTAVCWGDNSFGQLGTGTQGGHLYIPGPAIASTNGAFAAITAGGYHTCAITISGNIQCWGLNNLNQLGGSSNVFSSAGPLNVLLHVYASDVAAIGNTSCARIVDGSVKCWGDDAFGELGDGGGKPLLPVVAQTATNVVAISVPCAILADGTVTCWGFTYTASGLPGPPISGVSDAVEIATGGGFACALNAGGSIHCWGDNHFGQHGNGNTNPSGTDSVAAVAGTFLGRTVTSGNLSFTCGRRGNGTVACWGDGTQGQLGNAASTSSANPVAVTGISNAIGVSAGSGSHACAVDSQGAVLCWGNNSRGQLGNGTTLSSSQPVKVAAGGPYVSVAAGDLHTCALTAGGLVRCWGANDRGQLGNGGTADAHAPVAVSGIFNATAIAAGNHFACAIAIAAAVQCWGDNTSKQLGDSGSEAFSTVPVATSIDAAAGIALGSGHGCVLTGFGTVLCWGANSRGQIGNNSTQTAAFVTFVQGLSDAVAISAGAFFTCAAQAGGSASCWGANDAGELAAKDSLSHLTPGPVIASVFSLPTGGQAFLALSGVVAVSTGTSPLSPTHEHACALLASGLIRCWGDNQRGEIGDGTTVNRARPTAVNSFAANVDPDATLRNGRVALVTALVDCDPGAEAFVLFSLQQGGVTGYGQSSARCTSGLLRVPVTIAARGFEGFEPGPATAQVEAIVRSEDRLLEDTHWTRQVALIEK